MSGKLTPYPSSKLRFVDFFVLVFFISTAFLGLYLFRQDLMRTFDMRDVEPAGIIVVRNNIVQRRHDDRVLWDRIFVDSYVYPGDLIRAADLSSAAIDIANNEIFLNENSLIRIQASMDGGAGPFQVELREGNISVTSSIESMGIMLNVMGNQVHSMSGSVLDITADDEGVAVQVNEGTVELIHEGQSREIAEGAMVTFDTEGVERIVPSVVVRRPWNNARYLKSSRDRLAVDFEWSRVNIDADEKLRLEIARDINFRSGYRSIDGLDNSAQVTFDTGLWYWRLSYGDTQLRRGWLSVVDSSGPALISPVTGSVFRYQAGASENLPQLRFQWAEKDEASRYMIQISNTQDFSSVLITRESSSASLMLSELDQGTWYWRVRPIFSAIYNGETSFSQTGSFRIERTAEPVTRAVEIPAAAIERARENSPAIRGSSSSSFAPSDVIRPDPVTIRTTSGERQHTVRSGETLGRIAFQYYQDSMLWTRISQANNLRNPDLIYPGQVFIIP